MQTELDAKLTAARAKLAGLTAEVTDAEAGLRLACLLLHDASADYAQADGALRRGWNQTFFKRLWVGPAGVVGAELSDAFRRRLGRRPGVETRGPAGKR
jgi:hypothetical protein